MRSIPNLLVAALIAIAVGGCESSDDPATEGNAPAAAAREAGTAPREAMPQRVGVLNAAPCPEHLVGYCRGWTVFEAKPELRPDPDKPGDLGHIDFDDRIVVATKSQSTDPDLWLFARPPHPGDSDGKGPGDRWDTNKFRLYEITSGGEHDCLAGKVRLPDHSNTNGPHDWHQVTLRLGPTGSEIGNENNLEMCFTPDGDGSPPTECEIENCPEPDHPLLHGGVAHAQD
jgi:hypothetical protein